MTKCKFRHFLERHRSAETLFRRTERYLSERGLLLSEGAMEAAAIVQALRVRGTTVSPSGAVEDAPARATRKSRN